MLEQLVVGVLLLYLLPSHGHSHKYAIRYSLLSTIRRGVMVSISRSHELAPARSGFNSRRRNTFLPLFFLFHPANFVAVLRVRSSMRHLRFNYGSECNLGWKQAQGMLHLFFY